MNKGACRVNTPSAFVCWGMASHPARKLQLDAGTATASNANLCCRRIVPQARLQQTGAPSTPLRMNGAIGNLPRFHTPHMPTVRSSASRPKVGMADLASVPLGESTCLRNFGIFAYIAILLRVVSACQKP